MSIEQFIKEIPEKFLKESGSVFYSGRDAFTKINSLDKHLYLMGFNPGGDPQVLKDITIKKNIDHVLDKETCSRWNSYHDDPWSTYNASDWRKKDKSEEKGFAPRVWHVLEKVVPEPRLVPASNLIFVRTRSESNLMNKKDLALECWGFHELVIETLKPKVILCLGKYTGNFVAARLGANKEVCEPWVENNKRRWRATARSNGNRGPIVITAPHPSRAAWNVPATDPSEFIEKLLKSQ